MPNQLKAFISYSHKDEEYKDQLLKSLRLNPNISHWDDRQIVPGQDWDLKIKEAFQESQIILLLISPDFLDSNYILENELKVALEKHDNKKACVIPIFIRPCMLTYKPEIDRLQGLPKEKKYVSKWDDKDSAYLEIAIGIDQAIKELTKEYNSLFNEKIPEIKTERLKNNVDELKTKKKVFLAISTDDTEKDRRSIYYTLDGKKEHEGWPYEVIPNFDDSEKLKTMSYEEQQATIKKYLEESIFSIHLINTQSENNDGIINLQYDLAKRKCSDSLFKCIVGIKNPNPENELYKAVEEGRNTNPNILKLTNCNVSSVIDALDDLILENEKKMEALENKINPDKSVFLFYGSGDKENQLKEDLRTRLLQKNYNVRESIPDYSEAGIDARKWEEDELKKCEGAIILYGSAAEGWFIIRKALLMDYGKIKWKAVCIDEPNKDKKFNSLKVEPGLRLINNINEL